MKTKTILPVIFLLLPLIGNAQIQPLTWDTVFGGIRNDCFFSIEKSSIDGSVFMCGYTRSPSIQNYNINNINTDGWITKTNSSGSILWSKAYGTKNDEVFMKSKILPDGDIVTIGTISLAFPVAATPSDYHGDYDIFVTKIKSSNGDTLWQKCYGGVGEDVPYDVVIAPDGTIVIAGGTSSVNGDFLNCVHYGSKDGFLLKIDTAGSVIATKKNGGTLSDRFDAISLFSGVDGGFLLTGWVFSNDGTVSGQNHSVTNATSDMWVTRLDNNLNEIWTRCIGSAGQEEGRAIVDNGSNIFVSGITIPSVPFGDISAAKGLQDGVISKLDYLGNVLWTNTYGGTLNDYGLYLKANHVNGEIYAFGVTESSDLDIPNNQGYEDACFLLIDTTSGSVQDVEMWGTPHNEMFYDVLFLDSGFVAVGQHLPVMGPNWEALIASTSVSDFKLGPNNPIVTGKFDNNNLFAVIYPNPTSGMMRITMPPENTTNTITIYTMSGQVLFSEQTSEVVYTTDLAQFAQGTYVVEVKNSTGVFRDRVQKL